MGEEAIRDGGGQGHQATAPAPPPATQTKDSALSPLPAVTAPPTALLELARAMERLSQKMMVAALASGGSPRGMSDYGEVS